MKKRYFIMGFALAIVIGLSGIGLWLWKKPVSLSGGGKGLDSPDGHYKANAMNLLQRHVSGNSREYYSFTVIDNHSGLEVCRYEIPMTQKPVWFREGTGEIHGKATHRGCVSAQAIKSSGAMKFLQQIPSYMAK